MEKQTIRIRRVGSITFGTVLVISGAIFLLRLFFQNLNYAVVFRLWPIILILLGIEVLLGARQKTFEVLNEQGKIIEQSKVVYDVPALSRMFCRSVKASSSKIRFSFQVSCS